jgi:hypothetical protein
VAEFTGGGVSFRYPDALRARERTDPDGEAVWEVRLVPDGDSESRWVLVADLAARPMGDARARSSLEQAWRASGGVRHFGPRRTTVGGHPGWEIEFEALDVYVIRLTTITAGGREYTVDCSWPFDERALRRACEQVLATFAVSGGG